MFLVVTRRISIRGFIVMDHGDVAGEFYRRAGELVRRRSADPPGDDRRRSRRHHRRVPRPAPWRQHRKDARPALTPGPEPPGPWGTDGDPQASTLNGTAVLAGGPPMRDTSPGPGVGCLPLDSVKTRAWLRPCGRRRSRLHPLRCERRPPDCWDGRVARRRGGPRWASDPRPPDRRRRHRPAGRRRRAGRGGRRRQRRRRGSGDRLRGPGHRTRAWSASAGARTSRSGRPAATRSSSTATWRCPAAAPTRPASGSGVREVRTDYGGGVTMMAGHGSVATPGIVPSFAVAAERYAALPWARLVEPAAAAARAYPMGARRLALPGLRRRHALRRRRRGPRAGHRRRRGRAAGRRGARQPRPRRDPRPARGRGPVALLDRGRGPGAGRQHGRARRAGHRRGPGGVRAGRAARPPHRRRRLGRGGESPAGGRRPDAGGDAGRARAAPR